MTMTITLQNEQLYKMLCRYFGNSAVEVVAPGEPMAAQYVRKTLPKRKGEKKRRKIKTLQVLSSGEEFKANCPFCNDTRHRLLINHRWGVPDPKSGGNNLWLAQCFNESCLSSYDNRRQLFEAVYSFAGQMKGVKAYSPKAYEPTAQVVDPKMPEKVVRLDKLAAADPHHHCLAYLEERGFDPVKLGKVFKLAYCEQSSDILVEGRLIIPIFFEGKFMGWQARMLEEFHKGGPPKYLTMKHMRKSLLMYNFDQAIRYKTFVIVEGPSDVWAVGSCAAALLGKTMNVAMRKKLVSALHPEQTVAIVLDPSQSEAESRKIHHIRKLYRQLEPGLPGRVFEVYLPGDFDPGSMDRKPLRRQISRAGEAAGVPVSFERFR